MLAEPHGNSSKSSSRTRGTRPPTPPSAPSTSLPTITGNRTLITVEDDGPGFTNIADAYTLLGNTAKRF